MNAVFTSFLTWPIIQREDGTQIGWTVSEIGVKTKKITISNLSYQPRVFRHAGTIIAFTFSWSKSRANCRPTAFMSLFCRALVMYMCISRKRSIVAPSSACSISSWESRLTNHSNERWSRFIQKKSTCNTKHYVKSSRVRAVFIMRSHPVLCIVICSRCYLSEVHDCDGYLTGPGKWALWTGVPGVPVAMHDWLKNRSEWCYSNASGYQHCVLGLEYVTGWGTVRTIQIYLLWKISRPLQITISSRWSKNYFLKVFMFEPKSYSWLFQLRNLRRISDA